MRRNKHAEQENHERWLVSYADFMTLLFAFFVVMYSVSSVSEDKYQTVSDSIKAAFDPVNDTPMSRLPFAIGTPPSSLVHLDRSRAKEHVIHRMQEVVASIPPMLTEDATAITVQESLQGTVTIALPESILFQPGEAQVRAEALPFLKALSEVVIELDRPISIHAHTDNVPIRTVQFPSNWELSMGRAVMVARMCAELYGVPTPHLSASGFADGQPVASNETPEGRAQNRRVEIVVSEKADSVPDL